MSARVNFSAPKVDDLTPHLITHEFAAFAPPILSSAPSILADQLYLQADRIEKIGLGNSVINLAAKILDGVDRFVACRIAGVKRRSLK